MYIKCFLILSIILVLIALIYMNCNNIEQFSTNKIKEGNKLSIKILIDITNKINLTKSLLIDTNAHSDKLTTQIEEIEEIKDNIYIKLPLKIIETVDNIIKLNEKNKKLNKELLDLIEKDDFKSIKDDIDIDLAKLIPYFDILKKTSISIINSEII